MYVKKVGILGGGVMGSAIADIMALSGKEVVIKDVAEEILERSNIIIQKNLDELIQYQQNRAEKEIKKIEQDDGITLTQEQRQRIMEKLKPVYDESTKNYVLSKIKTTMSWDDFKDVDLVIEAIVEDISAKKEAFKMLDQIAPKHAILASNTSSLSITEIASATNRGDKVIGLHFFNPPITLPLVEIIPGLETSEEVANNMIDFISVVRNHRHNMQPVKVKDSPGFLVNRVLFAMLNEAFACYEEGVASMRDIDLAMKSGAGIPMGPFELSDLIGIDVMYHISKEMNRMNGGNVMQRPVQIINKMFHAGRWGRKTGRGFYDYK
ncbi:MAG: 3-hydroxyacyl-CoA dehydrogenase family protein [Thaumarchaeota archaeon]|nr:3-hydroxyacyl-CoA dehydrogenase family protein [Nitrososphaerota archaeon]